jgi:ParB-like chromosome segregation protein Spo0J
LRIEYRPLDALVPYAANARRHSPRQIEKLALSLETYGWTFPMAVADNGIIAGHGRLAAALKLRAEGRSVRGHADPNTGPTIDLSHLSKAERRAYILADNRLAEEATWDLELLRGELIELDGLPSFDLSLTGFNPDEIGTIMGGWETDFTRLDKIDAALDPLLGLIRVRYPRAQHEAVLTALTEALKVIPDVTIEAA